MNAFEFAFSLALLAAFVAFAVSLIVGKPGPHEDFNPDQMSEHWRGER